MERDRGGSMMHGYGIDGWDWYWMASMMVFWIVVLAIVIYAAVRLALHDERRTTRNS
jgi:uncharacterized membrane protein